ncbi:MAG: MBL fold metallo-hydrolase [Candidatus Moraniibacteriota bacterium]
MLIQYYGDYCFKITTKPGGRATDDVTLLADPLPKGAGLRSPQGEADIVLLTHGNVEEAKEGLKGAPAVFDCPGEYAAKGISLLGIESFADTRSGELAGPNTVFAFETEDIHCAFLGALGHDLSPEALDRLGTVDVLFIPIGEEGSLSAEHAAALVKNIEPNVVIPMHYALPGLTLPAGSGKKFFELLGSQPSEKTIKWNIKKKDIEGKKMEIVMFERGS